MEEMVADLVGKLIELPEEVLIEVIKTIASEKEIDLMALVEEPPVEGEAEMPVEGEAEMPAEGEEEMTGPAFGPQNFM